MIKKKDLINLRYYIDEKKRINKEIENCIDRMKLGFRSSSIILSSGNGNVKTSQAEEIYMHNEKLYKALKKRLSKLNVIIIKLYKIIDKITDAEIKTIVELRVIHGKKFEDIGVSLHQEQSTVRKKYNNFINSDCDK